MNLYETLSRMSRPSKIALLRAALAQSPECVSMTHSGPLEVRLELADGAESVLLKVSVGSDSVEFNPPETGIEFPLVQRSALLAVCARVMGRMLALLTEDQRCDETESVHGSSVAFGAITQEVA